MRLSSSLPPAGFTRAEPSPPGRRRVLPAVVVLVLGAGLVLAVGYGMTRTTPARRVTPEAATPAPSASPAAPPAREPEPEGEESAARPKRRTPRRGHSAPAATHHRTAVPRRPRPRPSAKHEVREPHKTRSARPEPPSWIAAECRRRFPDDPRRRAACVAVLNDRFGR